MQAIIYVLGVVSANFSAFVFGPSITPLNSFLFIGMDFSLRDSLHEKWRGNGVHARMALLILAGGIVSYALNPAIGRVAFASCVSFVLSSLIDHATYSICFNKHYLVKSNTSNAIGSAVDSIVFPTVAFGSLMPEIIAMQFAAKMVGGFVWSIVLHKYVVKTA